MALASVAARGEKMALLDQRAHVEIAAAEWAAVTEAAPERQAAEAIKALVGWEGAEVFVEAVTVERQNYMSQ